MLFRAPRHTLPARRSPLRTIDRVSARSLARTSAQSAAALRMVFGLLVTYGSVRFLAKGWVNTLYLEPTNHLSYPGFSWVAPLPWWPMHLVVVALAVCGLCIAMGFHQRVAAGVFVVGFVYTELIEATLYLNHYWFMTLMGALLCVVRLDRLWSVDVHRGRLVGQSTIAAGVVWVLRFQVAVVYVFAGLAKANGDWLLRAMPMRLWLADRGDVALVGRYLGDPAVAFAASWAGLIFDGTIVGWLLWRRSRPLAYAAVVAFHLSTAALFQIGIFPWVMIFVTPIFFAPDWPGALVGRVRSVRRSSGTSRAVRSPIAERATADGAITTAARPNRRVMAGVVLLVGIQVVIPLRHYAYDGNVRWTEEGYYGSWRVMLTEKAGWLEFRVHDPATDRWIEISPESVLTDWQARQAAIRPDLLLQTAHLVADQARAEGIVDPEVYAEVYVSFNGRPRQRLIDPTQDLAAVHSTRGIVLRLDPAVR